MSEQGTTPLERVVEARHDIAGCLREHAANVSGWGGRCGGDKGKAERLDRIVESWKRLADDVEALEIG